jgi:hypothetical protein
MIRFFPVEEQAKRYGNVNFIVLSKNMQLTLNAASLCTVSGGLYHFFQFGVFCPSVSDAFPSILG